MTVAFLQLEFFQDNGHPVLIDFRITLWEQGGGVLGQKFFPLNG